MAQLDYQGRTYTEHSDIQAILKGYGVPFEHWGVRGGEAAADDEILSVYKPEIDRLMRERHYQTVDLVALQSSTPGLEHLLAKFDREHHHVDDEVRFTVAGEGIFEIEGESQQMLKFRAQPGDLIVIPARHRHAFYLTEKKNIRCIRLFKTKQGWEAIYPRLTTN